MSKHFEAEPENRNSRNENSKSDTHGSEFRDSKLESPASPVHPITGPPDHPIITGRWKSYELLLLARLKEMYREPEVIFWVFIFPILLALGLGIAFRNKPADVCRVALVAGPEAAQALELLRAASAAGSVHAEVLPAAEAFNQFRLGKYDLVVTPRGAGFEYLYDPARPESVLARSITDDALQAAAGRKNRVPSSTRVSSEPG